MRNETREELNVLGRQTEKRSPEEITESAVRRDTPNLQRRRERQATEIQAKRARRAGRERAAGAEQDAGDADLQDLHLGQAADLGELVLQFPAWKLSPFGHISVSTCCL